MSENHSKDVKTKISRFFSRKLITFKTIFLNFDLLSDNIELLIRNKLCAAWFRFSNYVLLKSLLTKNFIKVNWSIQEYRLF